MRPFIFMLVAIFYRKEKKGFTIFINLAINKWNQSIRKKIMTFEESGRIRASCNCAIYFNFQKLWTLALNNEESIILLRMELADFVLAVVISEVNNCANIPFFSSYLKN